MRLDRSLVRRTLRLDVGLKLVRSQRSIVVLIRRALLGLRGLDAGRANLLWLMLSGRCRSLAGNLWCRLVSVWIQ